MDDAKLNINLLGTSFSIQTNEKSDYVDSIYSHYKEVVEQVAQNSDLKNDYLQTAILAGILITDELYKERLKVSNSYHDVEIEKCTNRMIMEIDKVINNRTDDVNLG